MSEEKPKHLEFIQGVITRLNTNSFQIKGWTVTIVAALLAVYASTKNELLLLVGVVPVVVFWFLDAYYLWQERKYGDLFSAADLGAAKPFTMDASNYREGVAEYMAAAFSRTILWLYMPLLLLLVGAYLYVSGCFGGGEPIPNG